MGRSARFENSLNYESSPDRNLPAPLPIWRFRRRAHKIPLVDTATEDWVLRNAFLDGWNDFRPRTGLLRRGFAHLVARRYDHSRAPHGQKSLDDFLRVFLGQPDTEPIVVPYTREDVEAALSAICPYKLARAF